MQPNPQERRAFLAGAIDQVVKQHGGNHVDVHSCVLLAVTTINLGYSGATAFQSARRVACQLQPHQVIYGQQ